MLKTIKKKRLKNKIKNTKQQKINELNSSDFKKDILDYKKGRFWLTVKSKIDVISMFEDFESDFDVKVSADIVNRCKSDLELFGKTFFNKIFTGDFCSFHREVFHSLEEYVINKKDEKYYYVRAAPRGHGDRKSVV